MSMEQQRQSGSPGQGGQGMESDELDQYLTFMLDGEEYGVDILRVQEIRGWDTASPIPNTPDYIKGVINLRGTIVPIIDLRRRFDLEEIDYSRTTVVIVLKVEAGTGQRTMGIVVDGVSDVYSLEGGQVNPPPDFGSAIDIEFVKGLATVEEKMLILLDIDNLLNLDTVPAVAAG